jgi:nucleoid-associated protein YgaU
MLALAALVLICSPLFAWSVSRPSGVAPVAPVARVIVQQGDTLWGIATQYGPPREDVRSIVYRIQQANRLDTSLIHPGDVLLVPQ